MSVPTWATVVGVLMVLLGGCGAYNNINKINAPKMLEASSEIFDNISSEVKKAAEEGSDVEIDSTTLSTLDSLGISVDGEDELDSADIEVFENIFGKVETMMNFSDYYKKWIVRLGLIGAIVALIYVLGGIFLIMGKPFSLKLVYGAIGLSIAFMIFQIVIMSMDKEGGMVSRMSTNIGSYFMIFINIILLIIILASDKSYFHQFEAIEE